jgi:hypothetical protein
MVSVILVREHAEQLTGSGCCGKLEGDSAALGDEELFQEARRNAQDFGVLHRAVRQFFPPQDGAPQVNVETVDPRNQLYLFPKLWADVLRYRPGFWPGIRTAFQLFSLPAVIVNGRVISRRHRPVDPDTLCHAVGECLDEASSVA